MLEDMAMRGLREETQRDYIRFVGGFATFLGRAPDTATAEDIRRFQVHQTERGVQTGLKWSSQQLAGGRLRWRVGGVRIGPCGVS